MASVTFTNPTDLPAYQDWDFEVFGAEYSLRAEDLRDALAAWADYYRSQIKRLEDFPAFPEANRVVEIHRRLTEACNTDADVSLNDEQQQAVWVNASKLLFQKKFVRVQCPACRCLYGPEDCQVLTWTYGEWLVASGGHRLVCPAGLILHSIEQWNSWRPTSIPRYGNNFPIRLPVDKIVPG